MKLMFLLAPLAALVAVVLIAHATINDLAENLNRKSLEIEVLKQQMREQNAARVNREAELLEESVARMKLWLAAREDFIRRSEGKPAIPHDSFIPTQNLPTPK